MAFPVPSLSPRGKTATTARTAEPVPLAEHPRVVDAKKRQAEAQALLDQRRAALTAAEDLSTSPLPQDHTAEVEAERRAVRQLACRSLVADAERRVAEATAAIPQAEAAAAAEVLAAREPVHLAEGRRVLAAAREFRAAVDAAHAGYVATTRATGGREPSLHMGMAQQQRVYHALQHFLSEFGQYWPEE